jgi:pyruvate dehydrogenase E1 component
MSEVLRAAEILETANISADIWSVTSYTQLSREALQVDRYNLLHPEGPEKQAYVQELLSNESGIFVAASDYMKVMPMSIEKWIPGRYTVLGTDGFGLSESRPDLRRHFEVSAEYIAYAAATALYKEGLLPLDELKAMAQQLDIDTEKHDPATASPATINPPT